MTALFQKIAGWYLSKRYPCQYCQGRAKFRKIQAIIETIPETGIPLHDDAVSAIFNAADDAESLWECYCGWAKWWTE